MKRKNKDAMIRLYNNMTEKYDLESLFMVAMDSSNADIVRITALDALMDGTICDSEEDIMRLGILFSRVKHRAFFDGSNRVYRCAWGMQAEMESLYDDWCNEAALPLSVLYGVSYDN